MNRQAQSGNKPLTNAQQNALEYVREDAKRNKGRSLDRIAKVLTSSGIQSEPEMLIASVRCIGRVTANFHLDRLLSDGRPVAAALYEDGVYRSQFETKISNGGLTAIPGGARDLWEESLFGGAYQASGVIEAERPKYGGLNLMNYSDGACPRFGSCHLRLKAATLSRSTLTFGDSVSNPKDIGVIDTFETVLAALLESIAINKNALGRQHVNISSFVDELISFGKKQVSSSFFHKTQGRALDDYIEAQVHGELNIATDVEAIVIDPSFQGTATGEILQSMADKYELKAEWHPGFELSVSEVPDDFRGPEMPLLAKRVAANYAVDSQHLDAAAIGLAAVSVITNPEQWQDWDAVKGALQHIKYLWHILVVYGKPWRQSPRRRSEWD